MCRGLICPIWMMRGSRNCKARSIPIWCCDCAVNRWIGFSWRPLGERFGQPFLHPLVDNGYDDCKAVLELLREPSDKAMFGGESWHADISWLKPAGYTSILHALEIPPVGGDTAFASTVRAFETLSPKLQDVLRGLEANHSYFWYERREEAGLLRDPSCCAQTPCHGGPRGCT